MGKKDEMRLCPRVKMVSSPANALCVSAKIAKGFGPI